MGWFSWIAGKVYSAAKAAVGLVWQASKAAVSWAWQNVARPVATRVFSEASVCVAEEAFRASVRAAEARVAAALPLVEAALGPVIRAALDRAEVWAREALVRRFPILGPQLLMALDVCGERIGVPRG